MFVETLTAALAGSANAKLTTADEIAAASTVIRMIAPSPRSRVVMAVVRCRDELMGL
jgi:hypothetical protein